jgi:hypothetical protein
MKPHLIPFPILLLALAVAATAQVMDLSCMQATRQKTDEMLAAYKEEGRDVTDDVFSEVYRWSQQVESEGKEVQDRLNARLESVKHSVEEDAAVQAAAQAVRESELDSFSPEQTRHFQEARDHWEKERARAQQRKSYSDPGVLESVKESLDKQGEWNRTEVALKSRLYEAEPPAKAVIKHEQEAFFVFEAKHGYVPSGEVASRTLGILAAMGEVAEKIQLGSHDVVLSRSQGDQGFVNAIEPVRVLLGTADLGELHGDMQVNHVQQIAPPPEIRRQAIENGDAPAADVMRSAAREAAVGLQSLGRAQIAVEHVRAILKEVPAPPSNEGRPPPTDAVTHWVETVQSTLKSKAKALEEEPIWNVIIK